VTGQQVCSTATDTFLIHGLFEGQFQIRMGSETKIIVTAERQHGFAINTDIDALIAQTQSGLAVTTCRFAVG
jgi:hypothetical protein